jgi:hypothetical protein
MFCCGDQVRRAALPANHSIALSLHPLRWDVPTSCPQSCDILLHFTEGCRSHPKGGSLLMLDSGPDVWASSWKDEEGLNISDPVRHAAGRSQNEDPSRAAAGGRERSAHVRPTPRGVILRPSVGYRRSVPAPTPLGLAPKGTCEPRAEQQRISPNRFHDCHERRESTGVTCPTRVGQNLECDGIRRQLGPRWCAE